MDSTRFLLEILPLHLAVQSEFIVAVLYLLDNGADVNLADAKGWTALHFAACQNNVDLCHILLKYGAEATLPK